MKHDKKQKGGHNNNGRRVHIDEGAAEFARATLKSYRKGFSAVSKKEAKKGYYEYLIDMLPDAAKFVIKLGHIKDPKVQETKAKIYDKLSDEGFIKKLTKEAKHGNTDDLELLPILINEKMGMLKREVTQNPEVNKDAEINSLIELCKLIIAKKYKKLTKKGVSPALAFDLLCIAPTPEAFDLSTGYRLRKIYECIYEHAKHNDVSIPTIMKVVVGKDHYPAAIVFALLDRNEHFVRLDESQRKVYIGISAWCFETLNEYPGKIIQKVLSSYVNARSNDDAKGKDAPRRYVLTTLPEADYPRLAKVIRAEVASNSSAAKYLA